MALKTRKPTGLPSWPIMLLAGREGAGKSWAAATASASDLVARTLWIGIGEDDPDEYAAIPGADFEIVEHDGTYAGILAAVRDAVAEPADPAGPTLIVVDSMTRLWNLIGDNAQATANRRAKGKKGPDGDFTISMDLWNLAAAQWTAVMDALRTHQGPSIVTARLDEVVVMQDGQPTKERTWKIQGHKSLPFDASIVVQLRERGEYLVTKVKSARHPLEKPAPFPGFSAPAMWERLGLHEVEAGERRHAEVVSDDVADEAAVADAITEVSILLRDAKTLADVAKAQARAQVVGLTPDSVIDADGTTLIELFNSARARLQPASSAPADESQPMALEGVS